MRRRGGASRGAVLERNRPRSRSVDAPTVEGFGFEWSTYDQAERDDASLRTAFERYFAPFPWDELPPGAAGVDIGCGTGRWARLAAERDVRLLALDASSDALAVARRHASTCGLLQASAVELPLRSRCLDFAFSLGVLHHLPDTAGAIAEIHRVLKPGAPFLVYLYYAFDNRPAWFRALWAASDAVRRGIARSPHRLRLASTRTIAAVVYLPLARLARLLERRGRDVSTLPLSAYRDQPYYVMQTDALDRFGTRLEKRFTRAEIEGLLVDGGFTGIRFGDDWPYWVVVARA